MVGILFLILVFLNGFILSKLFLSINKPLIILPSSFVLGSVFTVVAAYVFSLLVGAVFYGSLLFVILNIFAIYPFLRRLVRNRSLKDISISSQYVFFILISILFYFFYNQTLSYNSFSNQILISTNLYQDFGAHISIIRSFSMGNNIPFTIPFFQGEKLLYYFFIHFFTGVVEAHGLRIDIAYNIISALSLASLIFFIKALSDEITHNIKSVGIIAVLMFLLSSNLSFLSFLKENIFSSNFFENLWTINLFYEGRSGVFSGVENISSFWGLNTFTNQRQLVFGMSIIFFIIFIIISKKFFILKEKIFIGILIGLMPFWHLSMYISICLFIFLHFLLFKKFRLELIHIALVSLFVSIPQVFFLSLHSGSNLLIKPGFIFYDNIFSYKILQYWLFSIGLNIIYIPLSYFFLSQQQKKYFILFQSFFFLPNMIILSDRSVIDNHKFFNLWISLSNIFVAFFLIKISRFKKIGKMLFFLLFVPIIFSGFIQLMVIKNDIYEKIYDKASNPFMSWAPEALDAQKISLTNGDIYDPLSILGKKILLGRSHYVFLYGGDPDPIIKDRETIFSSRSEIEIKSVLSKRKIKYIVIYKGQWVKNTIPVNPKHINKIFNKIYEDKYALVYEI